MPRNKKPRIVVYNWQDFLKELKEVAEGDQLILVFQDREIHLRKRRTKNDKKLE